MTLTLLPRSLPPGGHATPLATNVRTFRVALPFETDGGFDPGTLTFTPAPLRLPVPAMQSQNHSVAWTVWWRPSPHAWAQAKKSSQQIVAAAGRALAAGLANGNLGVLYVLPLLTVVWYRDTAPDEGSHPPAAAPISRSPASRGGRGVMNLTCSLIEPCEPPPQLEPLRIAIAADPDSAQLHHDLAISLLLRGDTEGAAAAIETSLALAPADPRAHRGCGQIHLVQNELAAARASFQRAVELDPDDVEANAQLAVTLILAGEAEEALCILSERLRVRGDVPLLWANLGAALLARGRLDDGVEAYRRALELDPSWNGIRADLAIVLFTCGRFAEAAAERRRLAERDPGSAELLSDLAVALCVAGDIDDAVEVCEHAAALSPELHDAVAAIRAAPAGAGPAPASTFVKQYGERRTGTNLLRTLLAANYDAEVLMHILGDKHSPPAPLDGYWRDAQTDRNPARAFACRATFSASSLTTTPFSLEQVSEVTRLAGAIGNAFAAGALRYVISIRDPYAWAASLAWFVGAAARGQLVPAECAGGLGGACVEFNARYAQWLQLAERLPSRAAFVRFEELRAEPESVCDDLASALGLTRRTDVWRNQDRMVLPAGWDNDREPQLGARVDGGSDGLHQLSPECRAVVEATIDWPLVERIYALAAAIHPPR
jgi:Flp pilus assembly protein TadD